MKVEDLLPEKYREKAADYEKGTDTMDVWFDSGNILLKFRLLEQGGVMLMTFEDLMDSYYSNVFFF